jgi:sugar phosphate isomerase/epimerase
MDFYLSTNWNAARHATGEGVVDEILALGFAGVELGYQLSESQAAGVLRRVHAGAVRVSSVHAYAPYPLGAPGGHPELYLLASRDEDDRVMATLLLQKTLRLAAEAGARAVVLHAGRIPITPASHELIESAEEDGLTSQRYTKLWQRNQRRRARRAPQHFEALYRSLDLILPLCARLQLTLCLENLPSWEAIPTEDEMIDLHQRYASPQLEYWHDIGHGQVRENLGWIQHRAWAERLLPITAGLHIHDVRPMAQDHLPPPHGRLPFADFAFYGTAPVLRVFEPAPNVPSEDLLAGRAHVQQAWTTVPTGLPPTNG